MTHININLTGVEDPFAPADEGTYSLNCIDADLKSSNAGEQMAVFEWEIIGDTEFAGKKIFDRCMLEGKGARFGLFRLKQIMEATGGDLTNPDVKSVIGKTIRALVTVEISNDPNYGDQNRIAKIL